MATTTERGSARLREAWKNRALTDESVSTIAEQFDASKAVIDHVSFRGGDQPSAVTVGLTYEGDDVPICGNDLLFWLKWHHQFGNGTWVPPKVIINGIPNPEIIKLLLTFGDEPAPVEVPGLDGPGLGQVGGFGG